MTTFEHSDAESDVYPSLENYSTTKIKFPKKPGSLIAENDQGIVAKYDFIVTISKFCLFLAFLQILYKKKLFLVAREKRRQRLEAYLNHVMQIENCRNHPEMVCMSSL